MKFVTIKVWTRTRKLAKVIAVHRGLTLVALLQRLLEAEAKRLEIEL